MTTNEALEWAERHTEISMGCPHKEAFNPLCAEVRRLRGENAELKTMWRECHEVMCDHARNLAATESKLKRVEEVIVAAQALLEWALWIKQHIHKSPRMNEPNTGATDVVADALQRYEEDG